MTDSLTKDWIKNPSDEIAAKNGCRFDMERAKFAVDWIERYCYLYEGVPANTKMKLADWQLDFVQRLFGWVRFNEDRGREVRRFRQASVWIPKKNGKSPTLAALGVYMLCAEGEQGQKCYSTAKDGTQAMIAHRHALEMIRASPELNDECSINKSTSRIVHLPSNSFYAVVAGDNKRSQEGLNGSVFVDETHVVDAELMSILKGAGISRAEPLHVEVSTAGNNPDGYGKQRFDRGRMVESGKVRQDDLLYVSYAAPQDLADGDLDANLEKYGKAANPTWGRIIMPSEFRANYEESKHSMASLADFKMYRLNIWQKSANPWLKHSDWKSCEEPFTEDDLQGRVCFGGLDLARTRDFTALGLVFPWGDDKNPERVRVLVRLWVPEQYARDNAHLVPLLDWARDGHIILTPGDVVDFGYIRAQIRKDAKKFRIRELAYDPWHAEETTQAIEQGVTDDAGKLIEEGTGIKRIEFTQGIKTFSAPTSQFERLVLAKNLRHHGNPALDWMAGHVEVRRDDSSNMRPVKPDGKKDSIKKIDGIVALIMGLGAYMAAPKLHGSKYEREGLATV